MIFLQNYLKLIEGEEPFYLFIFLNAAHFWQNNKFSAITKLLFFFFKLQKKYKNTN